MTASRHAAALAMTVAAVSVHAISTGVAAPARGTGVEVVLEDPAGDDDGPGSYAYPAVEGFRPGSFDLRKVTAREVAGGIDLEISFQATVDTALSRIRMDSPPRRIWHPVVDIYWAVNPAPGSGHRLLLPGRRVVPAGDFGWDRAVVVSAVPDLLEAHYGRYSPDRAADTCFPKGAVLHGKTVRVHVPRRCVPSDLGKAGWLVVVTGLGPGAGLSAMVAGTVSPLAKEAKDPWVRAVAPSVGVCNLWEDSSGVETCTFGGCDPCDFAPFVLDAIVPAGTSQHELLRGFNAGLRRLAALPFVFPGGAPLASAVPTPVQEPRYPVVGVRGRELSVRFGGGPEAVQARYPAGTLGAIICPGERPGGSVVVKGHAAGFLVLERVADESPLCEGAAVVF